MSALHEETEVIRAAEQLATRLTGTERSFAAARQHVEAEYLALLNAIKATHERFAFDRDGRPGAVNAVREALPAMEREIGRASCRERV